MDKIFVRGLQLQVLIGVWEWERRNRQRVLVDLDLSVDTRAAGRSDRIQDTVDYSKVVTLVKELAEGAEHYLVETLGETLARRIVEQFAVESVRVRVAKPGIIPDVQEVGIELVRQRSDYGA